MARTPIYAAGGIVVRGGSKRPRVAVVQRSKDEAWVLPRGKLKRDENPVAGARREVVEETGHRVQVHEFVGAMTYRARGRPKVVQFWRMQAYERPSRDVMKDIIAVEWLPLSAAVRRLSYPLEKLFLQYAGRRVLKHRRRPTRKKNARARRKNKAARRKTAAARGVLKARSAKTRARKVRAPAPQPPARAAKASPRIRRARPHRQKPRLRAPVRIAAVKRPAPVAKVARPARAAAAKQASVAKRATPVRAAAATPAPASAKRATVLERVFGRLGR